MLRLAVLSVAFLSPVLRFGREEVRVEAHDTDFKPVVPDRVDCEVIDTSTFVGQLAMVRECAGWNLFRHPERVGDSTYVPFTFSRDGFGNIQLPSGTSPSGVSMRFLVARSPKWKWPASVLYEPLIAVPSGRVWSLVFRKDLGRHPVVTRPPTCTLLAERDVDPSLVRIRLSVGFSDPEGKELTVEWMFEQGRAERLNAMDIDASVFTGRQQFTVLACDPEGNCTAAYLPVEIEPLPGYEPRRPHKATHAPRVGAFPQVQGGKLPVTSGRLRHGYFPRDILRCAAGPPAP